MRSVLITGSNRGLGLEWVRQYAAAGWRVYATCRRPDLAAELEQLAAAHPHVSVHGLDVTEAGTIKAAAGLVGRDGLDLLVNNAGVYFERWGKDVLGKVDYRDWEQTFRVNTLGAMRVTEALVEPLARGNRPLVVAITSHMGSIADITSPRDYAYRSSKAALNAAMKGLSADLAPRGIGVLMLHPGWVRTRMGGATAPLTPEESVSAMRGLVEEFELSRSGTFLRYDGSEIPW